MATRQRPRSTRLLVVTLVAISLATITLDYREGETGPLAGLGRSALGFMEPMQKVVTNATRPIGNFFSGLAHLPTLAQENQDLENQLRDAQAAVAAEGNVRTENEVLHGLLGLKESLDPEAVAAVVTGNGLSNFEWTITIDKGSDDGITRNMPVVTGTQFAPLAVGRVAFVSPSASRVELVIDRRSEIAGYLGTTRESGKVVGQGEGDLRLELVEPGTEIAGNESVYTQGYCLNGQSAIFPPDVLIGQVSRTIPQENAIEEAVNVRPAVDFATLRFVLVLKTGTTCP